MGTKQFSNPQALSSTLTVLGMLQPQAIRLLNCLVPLVLTSNYYVVAIYILYNTKCSYSYSVAKAKANIVEEAIIKLITF